MARLFSICPAWGSRPARTVDRKSQADAEDAPAHGPEFLSKRRFWPLAVLTGLLLALSALPTPAGEESPQRLTREQLLKDRRKAAHSPRRIIFNNDGDDVIYTKKEPTREALLALRTSPLLGSQVDSIFYSNSLCFGQALHNSKVMEPFTCTDDIFIDNGLPQLMARGLDPIESWRTSAMTTVGRSSGTCA